MKRFSFLLFSLFLSFKDTYAQDIHFSQFYNTMQFINPATISDFEGKLRISNNYRQQWTSVSSPYRTIEFAGEVRVKAERRDTNYLSLGVLFLQDRQGTSRLSSTQFGLNASYAICLSHQNILSFGLQGSYCNKSINTSELKFGNQFNGNYFDSGIHSGENLNTKESISYPDFSSGLIWIYSDDFRYRSQIGFSISHLIPTNTSFLNLNARVNRKFNFHSRQRIRLKKKDTYIIPAFLYSRQGSLQELIIGSLVEFQYGMNSLYTGSLASSSLGMGFYYRFNDAIIPAISIEYRKKLLLEISYDVNVSSLRQASYWQGGVELSLVYKLAFIDWKFK